MSKESAGLLIFRRTNGLVEVLLAHPAGPIWEKRDTWSIPKGELDEGEDRLTAAFREFKEETGLTLPKAELLDLGSVKQRSGKINFIWALEADPDLDDFTSESFTMEWPPKSGRIQEFPETDRVAWFDLATAKQKLFKAQAEFIDRLAEKLHAETEVEERQQSLL